MVLRLIITSWILFLFPLAAGAQPRLDDHGFPLPEGAVTRLGDLHFAQPTPITAMALAPDGKTIASAGSGIFLWDAAKGQIVREITISQPITGLTFSKDGKLLAAATHEGAISVWNVASGKAHWQGKGNKTGWHGNVTGLRFIANERLLAVARTDTETGVSPAQSDSHVQLWDVATGDLKQSWQRGGTKKSQLPQIGDDVAISDVTLSPSGEVMAWLATSKSEKGKHCTVLIHETATGRLVREVKDLRAPAEKIDLLDEGQHLLVKSTYYSWGPEKRDEKGTLVLTSEGSHAVVNVNDRRTGFRFDYRLAYFISRPGGERRYVRALAVTPDGKSVYLQDEVGMVRTELATGKVLQEWRDHCNGIAFFPDGKRALLARGARLLECDEKLKPCRPDTEHCEAPRIHFLADGRLVALRWHGGRLNVWNTHKREIVESTVRLDAPLVGRTPCSYDSWHKLFAHHDETGIVVHDLLTNRRLSRLDGVTISDDGWSVWPLLCGDGSHVLVSSREKDATLVRWFNTKLGREIGRRRIADKDMFPQRIRPLDWYANEGSIFGYVAADGRLALMRCSNKERPVLVGIPEWVLGKNVEQSSRWPAWEYATAGFDRFVVASRRRESWPGSREYIICTRDKGQILRRFILRPPQLSKENLEANWYWHGTLSPDCRIMAVLSAGNEVRCYDTATGRHRGSIRVPNHIESLDFSADGKTLATSCADTSILLWDVQRSLNGATDLRPPGSSAEAEKLWQILSDPDPVAMAPALWALKRAPQQAMAVLKRHLHPVRGPEPEKMTALIAGLDSTDINKRQAASRELIALAEYAIEPLYAALESPLSLEQKRRVERLLAQLDAEPPAPKCLRELRGLELLEYVGTAEARAIVAALATGDAASLLTRDARLMLDRWPSAR